VCRRIAREHAENFPVASLLAPRPLRRHLAAIYAFARVADDMADEGARSSDERLRALDDWRRRLHDCVSGAARLDGSERAAIFAALGETIRACRLDVAPFDDLLSAFRQDVVVSRYDTWDALLDYCRRSANPVGRLVLRVAGYRDTRLDTASDALCTALQLTNFWQDVERDFLKGRVYVPRELTAASGAREEDLARREITPAWQAALVEVSRRTARLFDAGRPVADAVRGRLGWELRATWLGGARVLTRLEAAGFDVFRARPSIGWPDAAVIGWRVLTWR